MKNLFHKDSLTVFESLFFTNTLFAFDFDGTLSKIVPSPEDAYMTEQTAALLDDLNQRVPVAIVSGRSIEDLQKRLPFTPRYLVGNHGLESPFAKNTTREKAQECCKRWKKSINSELERSAVFEGIELEDKSYSLALHYRRSPAKRKAKAALMRLIESLDPQPRIIPGKSVINIIPAGGPHKGFALTDLVDRTGVNFAFYIGDDDTDEDVFALREPRIFSVRVGKRQDSEAQYYIERQTDIDRMLKIMLGFCREQAA